MIETRVAPVAVASAGPIRAEVTTLAPGSTDSLRRAWQRLFHSPGFEPSTSFEWTSALLRYHIERDDRLLLVQLRRGDEIVGAVPLIARATAVLGQLLDTIEPVWERYNTHSDLLLRSDRAAADAFLNALFDLDLRWDRFRMSKLLEESTLTAHLEAAAIDRGCVYNLRRGTPSYFLALPDSFDGYLRQRSGKFRNFLKRLDRRIRARGEPRVHEIGRYTSFDEAYDDLLDIERVSWKQEHGTAISAVARQNRFYRDMCAGAFAAGRLHLHFLTIDDKPVAYDLGLVWDGCYYYLKTSYDAAFRDVHPATFLRARLVENLIARGVKRFDFPGLPYEWERQWTSDARWHKVFSLYRDTARGRLLASIERLRHPVRAATTIEHVDPEVQHPRRT